jgi:L-rhamnose-H+ transport protein
MHLTGLLLIILGGIMEGLFALPMKFVPKWSWENIWGAGSLAALLLVPWPLALLTVPHLPGVYVASPLSAILLAILFGVGWGLGGVFFGLGVARLGLSIGTSLVMGLVAIGGSVVPMLLQHAEQMASRGGTILLAGIATMIVGLVVCARAVNLRTAGTEGVKAKSTSSPSIGLFYCLAAGLLSALVNFALIYGAPIARPAVVNGLDLSTANNAVWALVFTSNYVVNLGYCVFKGFSERTLHKFFAKSTTHYWLIAGIMGLLWAGGIVVYGRGASLEGPFGPIFGFPIMLIVSILTGNAAGTLSGEWRGQPWVAKSTMAYGVVVMLLAILILAYANYETRPNAHLSRVGWDDYFRERPFLIPRPTDPSAVSDNLEFMQLEIAPQV